MGRQLLFLIVGLLSFIIFPFTSIVPGPCITSPVPADAQTEATPLDASEQGKTPTKPKRAYTRKSAVLKQAHGSVSLIHPLLILVPEPLTDRVSTSPSEPDQPDHDVGSTQAEVDPFTVAGKAKAHEVDHHGDSGSKRPKVNV